MSSAPFAFGSAYIKALRQGDPAVKNHFAEYFNPILLRALRGKVRCADQARDIRQDTLLRVLSAVRNGYEMRNPERFETFVMSVCNNVLRETYRKQRRSVGICALKEEPVADLASAYSLVLSKEIRGSVRRNLAQLGGNEQGLLEAVFLQDQSRDEICRKLGVSRSNLRVLLHRAKQRFRLRVGAELVLTARRKRAASGRNSRAPVTLTMNNVFRKSRALAS